MADRTVSIDLVGRDKVSGAMKSASRSASHAEGTFSKFGKTARHLAGAFGLVVGLHEAVRGFKQIVGAGREANKTAALTNAVLKSTKGAAHVSAAGVNELANKLSEMTGIDDDVIKRGENLLLTFTGIRNEVGKGNKIFDRATEAVQNMSVALGQDTKSSAIQLGKALQDPIKGATSLRRVGVALTQQQQDQIKKFVESGHVLKAQKVILKELGTEFGGAATAAATPMSKLKATVHVLAEELGQRLIPFIDRVAAGLGGFIKGMQDGTGAGGRFATAARQIGDFLRSDVLPPLRAFGNYLSHVLFPALQRMTVNIIPALRVSLNKWTTDIAGVSHAWNRLTNSTNKAGQRTNAVVKAIGFVLTAAVRQFVALFSPFFKVLEGVILALIAVKTAIRGLGRALAGIGSIMVSVGEDFVRGFIAGIGNLAGAAKDAAANMAKDAVNAAKRFLHIGSPSRVMISLGEFTSQGFAIGIRKGGKHAIDAMKNLVDQVTSRLSDLKSQARDISSAAADSVRGILDVSGIGAPGTTPSGILKGFAAQAGAFAKALARMAKIGLAPAIIAAVAAAGPSALGAANAFASESKAQVRSDNASVAAINKAAASVGATARGSSGIDKKIDETNHLLRQLHRALAGDKVASLRISKGGDLIVEYVNKKNHVAGRRGHQ